ncbi:hypothetical protein MBLNU230_g0793t1 [Neophaeotheca triangularis]
MPPRQALLGPGILPPDPPPDLRGAPGPGIQISKRSREIESKVKQFRAPSLPSGCRRVDTEPPKYLELVKGYKDAVITVKAGHEQMDRMINRVETEYEKLYSVADLPLPREIDRGQEEAKGAIDKLHRKTKSLWRHHSGPFRTTSNRSQQICEDYDEVAAKSYRERIDAMNEAYEERIDAKARADEECAAETAEDIKADLFTLKGK